jgi:hypothetical protein
MVGIVLLVAYLGGFGDPPDDALALRAAEVIEQTSPAAHLAHGHEVSDGDQAFCGVDVFGSDGDTVYGYYFCAMGHAGVPYLESMRFDGPVVVHLGAAPTAWIAPPGAGYAEAVRAMMPDRYEPLCFSGLPDPDVAAKVRERYVRTLGG